MVKLFWEVTIRSTFAVLRAFVHNKHFAYLRKKKKEQDNSRTPATVNSYILQKIQLTIASALHLTLPIIHSSATTGQSACALVPAITLAWSSLTGFHRKHETARLVWMQWVGCRYAITPASSVDFTRGICGGTERDRIVLRINTNNHVDLHACGTLRVTSCRHVQRALIFVAQIMAYSLGHIISPHHTRSIAQVRTPELPKILLSLTRRIQTTSYW